jgi:hypothetical protein
MPNEGVNEFATRNMHLSDQLDSGILEIDAPPIDSAGACIIPPGST